MAGEAKVTDFGLSKMLDVNTPTHPADQPDQFVPGGSADDLLSPEEATRRGGRRGGRGGTRGGAKKSAGAFGSGVMDDSANARGCPGGVRRAGVLAAVRPRVPDGRRARTSTCLRGVQARVCGLKCDVYSFAVVVYEIFEGLFVLDDPVTWAHRAGGAGEIRPRGRTWRRTRAGGAGRRRSSWSSAGTRNRPAADVSENHRGARRVGSVKFEKRSAIRNSTKLGGKRQQGGIERGRPSAGASSREERGRGLLSRT